MIEIERKFLVRSLDFKSEAKRIRKIKQGFLNTDKNRIVRIRLSDHNAFITIKGESSDDGLERFEWEKEIEFQDAEELLKLCERPIIEKLRYEIPVGLHIFEVDEFSGVNEGLIIAEVELGDKSETYENPSWLGKEVTGDLKYYNSNLIKNPFKNWRT